MRHPTRPARVVLLLCALSAVARVAPARADTPEPAAETPAGEVAAPVETTPSEPESAVAAPTTSEPATPSAALTTPPVATPAPARVAPPPPLSHDFALEAGWNNPAGLGGRYLFLLPETVWAVGAAAGASVWGFRWAFVLRRAEDFTNGQFFQASLGFSTGDRGFELDVPTSAGTKRARFDRTPGRTVDVAYGYRIPAGPVAIDAFVGLSINFQGTVLQVEGPDGFVALEQATREELLLTAPGGLLVGLSVSWLQ